MAGGSAECIEGSVYRQVLLIYELFVIKPRSCYILQTFHNDYKLLINFEKLADYLIFITFFLLL